MWDDETIQDSRQPKHEGDERSSEPQSDALSRLERKVDEQSEAMAMLMGELQELREQIRQEVDASSAEREMAGELLAAAKQKEDNTHEMFQQTEVNQEALERMGRLAEQKLEAAASIAKEVKTINATVEGLPKTVREAGEEVRRETRAWWRGRTWKTHAAHALTAVVVVLLMGFLSLYALHTQKLEPKILTEEETTHLEYGEKAETVWWSLDETTRERLNEEHNLGWRTTQDRKRSGTSKTEETSKSKD